MKKVLFILLLIGSRAVGCSYAQQAILAEGKTKIIRASPENSSLVIIESKDDITAGNGARHDIISGKAALATQTTCNVFRLLTDCKIPVAFIKQLDKTKFLAPYCTMIPYEVVVRRQAYGSFLKRNPTLSKGHYFPQLIVEFFLKTNDHQWHGKAIPKDDPLLHLANGKAHLYLPDVPLSRQNPFMTLDTFPLHDNPAVFEQMSEIAKRTFLILEKAWQSVGGTLVDFKVEFGFDTAGNLLLADVIDNDSWRVIHDNVHLDKQAYREGADLNQVTALYQHVASLTDQFMKQHKRELLTKIVRIGAFKEGNFTLKNGSLSSMYIDLRSIISYPDILQSLAECLWQLIQTQQYDHICGVPYTALPIATALSLAHHIPMIIKRKEAKNYGTKKMVEGAYKPGDTCLLIEDVITTGSSILETIASLEQEGLIVTDIVVCVDREEGGVEYVHSKGYHVHVLYTLSEIFNLLHDINYHAGRSNV